MVINSKPVRGRRGMAILEFSLAVPILMIMTLGTVVLGLGVSQYQTVAAMAGEGARWGSVRGSEYQQVTGNPAATATSIYNSAILPLAVSIPSQNLSCSAIWSPNNQPGSTITVTVTYQWNPSAYLPPINISSSSVTTVSY